MRSALFHKLPFLLLLTAIAHCQGPPPQHVNPHTQIRWPANCHGPNMVYNYVSNQCVTTPDVTNLTPGPPAICPNAPGGGLTSAGCTLEPVQVHWPGTCGTGVYVPATNTCVPPGTAANPGGAVGQTQLNVGGVFSGIPGSASDANYGWKTQGGTQFAKGWQSGAGSNGIVNSIANGQTVVADPGYGVTTTANMTLNGSTFTVANPAGIVAGQVVSGNTAGTSIVGSVVGNTVTLSNGWAISTNPAATVTFYEMPYRLNNYNIPAASVVHFDGQWLGQHTDLKRDPPTNPFTGHQDFSVEGCFTTKHQSWIANGASAAGTNSTCHVLTSWFAAPGANYGQSMPSGPTNWAVTVGLDIDDTASNKGIGELFSGHHTKAGIGDGPVGYLYYSDYLGSVAGADEGQGGVFIGGGEAVQTYTGTVAAGGGGSGATKLSVACTIDCATTNGGPGDGRYMIDKSSSPIPYNMISRTAQSGLTPGTITTDATMPVSTFWGTLTANILTPPALNASGIPFADQNPATTQTFTVTSGTLNGVANTGAPVAGDLICFSAPWHEQAIITSVSGSNPTWTVVAPVRMAHTANSWIFANGACGMYNDFAANDAVATGGYPAQTQHYPFDIIGSTTANTLVYQWFSNLAGLGFPLGAIYLPVATGGAVVNVGGIVTFNSVTAATYPQYVGQTITISGATNNLYNGPCTNVTPNAAGFLTCYQAASTGQASSGGSIVTSIGTTGYGNTAATLWRGAEVLDILDYNEANCNAVTKPAGAAPLHAPCFDNKNITLEPNKAAWADGDAIEEPHHYSSQVKATKQFLTLYDPYVQAATNGWNYQVIGQGISNGGLSAITNWAQASFINLNPGSLYVGHGQGGTLTPPGGINLGQGTTAGVGYRYGLYITSAPEPNGVGQGVYIGCPTSPWGCTDPSYNYKVFEMAGRVNGNYISYNPYNSDMVIGNPNNPVTWNAQNNDINFLQSRDNVKFSPMATPVATTTTAASGGSIPDSTTRYYKITAISRAGAGSSLQSTEVFQTTGSSGSNTNTITVTWGHVTGAAQYQVCESSTSNGELLLTTITGVDATSFTDGGGTASGGCSNAGTQPGIDTAGFVKFQSPSGTGVDTLLAATGNASNFTHTLPPANGTLANGINFPLGTPTFVPGSNVASCACAASYTCTNARGRLTIAGGTATTGTVCTVIFSAGLTTVPFFTLAEMGATTLHGLDHSVPLVTSVLITAASSVSGATINLDYETQP